MTKNAIFSTMFLAYVGFRERKSLFASITLFSNPPLLDSV